MHSTPAHDKSGDSPRTTIRVDGVRRVYAADGRQLEGPPWDGPRPRGLTIFTPGQHVTEPSDHVWVDPVALAQFERAVWS